MSEERALAFLRELERADEEAAATLAELDELAREVEAVRTRAGDVALRLAALPGDRERARAAVEAAEAEAAGRRAELARVEAALAEAEGDARAAAGRAHVRARDRSRMADRRLAAARADEGRLEAEEESAAREARALVSRARELAEQLDARPALAARTGTPPAGGLEALAGWSTSARAALFVARGRLAAEREAVIRQANELGAAVLGEPLAAQSAALVAERVRRVAD